MERSRIAADLEHAASKEPLISVIVPTYCEEEHIERCLRSLRAQRFDKRRFEIIVVDSNSPDHTRELAAKYAHQVLNVKARGVGKARNAGAAVAQGELLLFVDADSVLDPGFLAAMCDSFVDSRVVCATGVVAGLERFGVFWDLWKFLHFNFLNWFAIFTASIGFPFFSTVCCACRKRVFELVGGFDEDIAVGEDIIFSRRMGKVGRCVVNRQALAYTSLRRMRKNGLLKNYWTYFLNYYRVFYGDSRPWINEFPHTREI